MEEKLCFPDELRGKLSVQVRNLIKWMLLKDQRKRASIE